MREDGRKVNRFTGDSGAVLAESALITPVFIFLLFGILEFGGAFRDYLTLSATVTAGARQEAIQGSNLQADWATIQAMKKGSSAMPVSQINMIVIWKATGPNDGVPTACKTSSQNVGTQAVPLAGSCNRFGPTEIASTTGATWICTSAQIQNWCPPTRKVALTDPPDYLGVYMQITHPWVTGLFGKSVTMSDRAITKLEPQKLVG